MGWPMQMHALAFLTNLAGPDVLIILGVALLIFGRRLAEGLGALVEYILYMLRR